MPYDRDGKFLSLNEAMKYWLPVAFDKLVEVAKTYDAYITYKDLGDHVMEITGISYGATYRWVGKLLGPIVHRCVRDGLPPLTSLVVHQDDQSVGEGYDENFRALGIPVPTSEDLEAKLAILDDHAAASRLECYKFFGAELPPGGGVPTLTPRIRAARDAKRAKAKAEERRPVCPIHFIELPVSGVCEMCD
jgi:hypothetical protein